jgi:predicted RNA-binding Zn ribbon-like protein
MLISSVPASLCLSYANTLAWRGSEPPTEALNDLGDLLGWLEKSAGIGAGAIHDTKSWSRDHQKKAVQLFADAIALRETVFRIFSAFAAGAPAPDRDFAALKAALAEAPPRNELSRADGRYAWRVETLRPAASHLLAPVLWSAADLLLSAADHRIRQCANQKCLWLFLDESKSGTRRWCDMSSCGNRAKAQRHYSRVKQG